MLVCSPPTFQLCCVCVWVRESAPLSRGFKMALACLLLLSWTGGTFSNVDRRAARRRDRPASCRCQGAGGQAYAWKGQAAKAVTKEVWATEAHRRRSLAAAWYFSPTLEGGWEAWEAAARP